MSEINSKLDEVALMVLMLHPNDEQSIDLVFDILNDVKKVAASSDSNSRLIATVDWLVQVRGKLANDQLIEKINQFVSAAQHFLNAPEAAVFPNEVKETNWGKDLSPNADAELIIEFIEKHTLQFEEFEARLMELAHAETKLSPEQLDEERRYIKAYLHNVKGDAGSVGFLGVEKTTHKMEELVLSNSPLDIVDEVLAYKEWVLNVCKSYSAGNTPNELSDGFLERVVFAKQNETKAEIAQTKELENVEVKDKVVNASVSTVEQHSEFIAEPYDISGDTDVLMEFVVEAEDHLNTVESILLEKETGYSLDDLNAIFRAVHSLKGGSAYFGLKEITTTSHSTENLMDKARNEKLVFNQALKSIVLRYIDLQRKLLEATKNAFTSGASLHTTLEAKVFQASIDDYLTSITLIEAIDTSEFEDLQIVKKVNNPTPAAKPVPEPVVSKPANINTTQPKPIEAKPAQEIASKSEVKEVSDANKQEKVEIKEFVKIDTHRLDRLIEYIGEMVISSSMLIRNCRDLLANNETVVNNSNQLERISREIQDIGMSMRLIPIKGLFQKMSRVVWDTAKKTGKEVRFDMLGEDTELDRSVIDKLADPLMHMVRNAVDHGIEPGEVRVANGKPKAGTVKLSASQAGGNIYIRIEDDGKGLDPNKLIAKAREKGIVSADQNLTEQEAFRLIFAPGFSTAQVVTDVSGRGVGMDVVRKNIESMRGKVNIESVIGKGSVFTIELPLTLAIMEGIEASIGDERFIIPSLSVLEFLRPTKEMILNTLDQGETLQFRGHFLPIFRLSDIYGGQPRYNNPCDSIMVIVDNGGKLVALMVDEVLGKLSVVIKSLGGMFQGLKGVSGCAIMPNGSVGLILDIGSLVLLAKTTVPQRIENTIEHEHSVGRLVH